MNLRFQIFSYDAVTLIRGISLLIILIIHLPIPAPVITSLTGYLLTAIGHVAIRSFFFLSGFVLAKGYLDGRYTLTKNGVLLFYWKRVRRIVPLYFLIVSYLFLQTSSSITSRLADLFHLLTFTATPQVHLYSSSYLWFISTLMQLYLLTPLGFFIIKIAKKQKKKIRLLFLLIPLLIGSVLKWQIQPHVSYEYMYSSVLSNIDIFLSGMFLAMVQSDVLRILKVHDIRFRLLLTILLFTLFTAFYVVSSIYAYESSSQLIREQHLLILLPIGFILLMNIILPLFPKNFSLQTMNKNFLPILYSGPFILVNLIGVYSYEMYLLHQPLLSQLQLSCSAVCTVPIFMKNLVFVTGILIIFSIFLDIGKKFLWRRRFIHSEHL
ncbi:acyltransferase family protein [Candidatus Gottesmanbacteria bacterium]|nr:acyltransferase family protein [Candidatus Gottesmanbacteria bacterium]